MARKEKHIHYLYKTTCLITGRWYIGMHSTNNIDDGYMGSGRRLRASIRKHGKENHQRVILGFFDNRELLIEAEINAITEDMIIDKDCMNLMGGGEGGFVNDNHYQILTKAGAAALKVKREDENFNKKWKINLSKSMQKLIESGKFIIPNKGVGHTKGHITSKETKRKMSETSKGMGLGELNSQHGTCWITNGVDNKKIKKGDTITEGWKLGCTRKSKYDNQKDEVIKMRESGMSYSKISKALQIPEGSLYDLCRKL